MRPRTAGAIPAVIVPWLGVADLLLVVSGTQGAAREGGGHGDEVRLRVGRQGRQAHRGQRREQEAGRGVEGARAPAELAAAGDMGDVPQQDGPLPTCVPQKEGMSTFVTRLANAEANAKKSK